MASRHSSASHSSHITARDVTRFGTADVTGSGSDTAAAFWWRAHRGEEEAYTLYECLAVSRHSYCAALRSKYFVVTKLCHEHWISTKHFRQWPKLALAHNEQRPPVVYPQLRRGPATIVCLTRNLLRTYSAQYPDSSPLRVTTVLTTVWYG
jgi:hypothetical protein